MTLVNVAIVCVLAVVTPPIARSMPGALVPLIVVEILAGLVVGPHCLGWLVIDGPVSSLALLGLTFLFFLAGLEVDLQQIRGRLLTRAVTAYLLGLSLAFGSCLALDAVGLLDAPALVAIALSATGLGLVIPILRDASLLHTPAGTTVVAFASVAEFAAVVLLALSFSTSGSPLGGGLLLAGLAALAVAVTALGRRISRSRRVERLIDSLSDGTVQFRVRLSVALVVGFAALAQRAGLEVTLGAFFAGGILNVLDRSMHNNEFRGRLDGIGYGFLIPIFFVTSGARLDFSALQLWPDALLLVPALLLLLLVARGLPELLLDVGNSPRQRVGESFLCATSLPFVVTAVQLGVATGRLPSSDAAILTTSALIGVCLFPALGVARLRGGQVRPRSARQPVGETA